MAAKVEGGSALGALEVIRVAVGLHVGDFVIAWDGLRVAGGSVGLAEGKLEGETVGALVGASVEVIEEKVGPVRLIAGALVGGRDEFKVEGDLVGIFEGVV